jgi:CRP-like cAMP-binding protein
MPLLSINSIILRNFNYRNTMSQIEENIKQFLQSLVSTPITQWNELEDIAVKKSLKKGDHFFQHYDHCDEVAIVIKGLFRIYLINQEGEEKTFSFIPERGFILDFFLTWDKSPSMVSVQAIEDSEIYAIKYDKFLSLMQNSIIWHEVYREVLLRNYMSKTKREIEFVLYNAKERLEKCLNSKHLDMNRIPKTYLASYLGIAPPSLSRLLRDFKEE